MVLYSTNIKRVFNHRKFSIVFDHTYNLIVESDLIFIIVQFHEFCFKKKGKKVPQPYLHHISFHYLICQHQSPEKKEISDGHAVLQ